MDITECVGKRCLVRILNSNIVEVRVLEVSPSGKYVKLRYLTVGHTAWNETKDIKLLEVLEPATEVRVGEVK